MLRVFQNDLADPDRFLVTFELIPGHESSGRSVEQIRRIAAEALIPPRMWELDGTSSWLNFHLGRDHHSLKSCMKQGSSCKV